MSYEAAKCPNCGATVQIQSNWDVAYCSYCDSSLIPKKTAAAQKTNHTKTNPEEDYRVSTIENDLTHGEQCLKAREWDKAYDMFSSAIDKNANNARAWYGCLQAMTAEFTQLQHDLSDVDGDKGLTAVIAKSRLYYGAANREHLKKKMETPYRQLLDEYTMSLESIHKTKAKKRMATIWLWICIFVLLIAVIGESAVMSVLLFIITIVLIMKAANHTDEINTIKRIYSEPMHSKLKAIQEAFR